MSHSGNNPRAHRTGFRTRGALARHQMHFGPNMTPMVDVVMVILVFFMASTAFVGPEWFLRAAVSAGPEPAEESDEPADGLRLALPETTLTIRLSVDDTGITRATGFGLEGASLGALAAAVRKAAPSLVVDGVGASVKIEPAPGVVWEDVVHIHEVCVEAGIDRIGL